MKIISREQDMAGKWRVRVAIDEDRAEFFKFNALPSDDEVERAVAGLLTMEKAMEEVPDGTTDPI